MGSYTVAVKPPKSNGNLHSKIANITSYDTFEPELARIGEIGATLTYLPQVS